jgi:hypothetical protein
MGEIAGTKGQGNKKTLKGSPGPLKVFVILNFGI